MFIKKNKLFSCLMIPLMALGIFSSSTNTTEAAANDGLWYYHIQNTWDELTEGDSGETIAEQQGKTVAPLGMNATQEQVRQYVIDSLNSNNALSDDVQIKGKTQKEDGSTYVAIRYDGDAGKSDIVLKVDETGAAITISDLTTDKEMQAAYDEIVYGGSNEMSTYDIESTNTYLHDSDNYLTTMADALGISTSTAASTAAGAVSLSGMLIFGAGASASKKREMIENADKAVKARAKVKTENTAKEFMEKNPSSIPHSDTGMFNLCIEQWKYDGLTEPTKQFLNTLSTNYYKETGIVINITSGYRPDDVNSWHSDGICFDATADEWEGENGKYYRTIYENMVTNMGGKPLDEYPGEPGEIYARGSNFHVSVHNQSTSY